MLLELSFNFFPLRSSIKYIELLTAIVGTVFLYKYKHTFLKYFLIILWYTAINEFIGLLIVKYEYASNIIIYNIYHLINFSFIFLLFRKYVNKKKNKNRIRIFSILYLISFFVNMFFENYFYEVQTVPFFVASVLIIISIMYYYSEILNTNEVLYVKKKMVFWISVGYLLYLSGNFPIRIVRNYFTKTLDVEYIVEVGSVLSIVMNICFIIGFIWSEENKQY